MKIMQCANALTALVIRVPYTFGDFLSYNLCVFMLTTSFSVINYFSTYVAVIYKYTLQQIEKYTEQAGITFVTNCNT